MSVEIIGIGHCLPKKIETNEELCKNLSIEPDWILKKTGIKRRYLVDSDESASSLAVKASTNAIEMFDIDKDEIDLIIVCTFSADYIFPPLSALLSRELGISNPQIFDLQANCAGLVAGLTVARDRLECEDSYRKALVVGVEVNSKYIDRADVDSCVYMSDAASAIVLSKENNGFGYMGSAFSSDSSSYEAVRMRNGGSSYRSEFTSIEESARYMEMNGIATWKQAVTNLPRVMKKCVHNVDMTLEDIDFIVFHQANLNMIEYIVKKLKIGTEKTYTNVEEIGNSGSASVGVALSEAHGKKLIKKGDLVMLAAVGAGFNFGASLWKWGI